MIDHKKKLIRKKHMKEMTWVSAKKILSQTLQVCKIFAKLQKVGELHGHQENTYSS